MIMKVIFKPQQFRAPERASNISIKGVFSGLGIDFLAVMARLYQMPYLWFSEGIFIEVDFDSEKLILKAPGDKEGDSLAKEVIREIPLSELICFPVSSLRDIHITLFAADLAEYNFGMPKTAKAIREGQHPLLISELAAAEGHPVLDTEIENLLFFYVFVVIFLINSFGIVGAAITWSLRGIVDAFIITWLAKRIVGISFSFFRHFGNLILGFLLLLPPMIFAAAYDNFSLWLVILTPLSIILYALLIWKTFVLPEEKSWLKSRLQNSGLRKITGG